MCQEGRLMGWKLHYIIAVTVNRVCKAKIFRKDSPFSFVLCLGLLLFVFLFSNKMLPFKIWELRSLTC